ncbi:hypothetical protein TCAL_02689 [Tigriopus californicus]|uniref:BTB domain-containing protein n=1 Tax=Tigriopus californicus TaxID=6832 RepID=A0A553PGP3_TIGCA|nr:BTB/POZ domain-containing protein KCTD9-like [Tigriopus californicus]TRY76842.1 hypothetical protein TCAL_02689 [Tigriopus californicus]
MVRVIVKAHWFPNSKGVVIQPNEIEHIDQFCSRLSAIFKRPVEQIWTQSNTTNNPTWIEIVDGSFIRDDDEIFVKGRDDPLPDESQSRNLAKWVHLNVGGRTFMTCKSTINLRAPESMLARMFQSEEMGAIPPGPKDSQQAILIDREPEYFGPILNFLRTGTICLNDGVNAEGVLQEAKFFGIDDAVPLLEEMILQQKQNPDDQPLTRRDIIAALTTASTDTVLRFQGLNMAGADLSRLDLRHINFKYANLRGANLSGANLSWCNLERADLSEAQLSGAQMLGVKMICANLERATMRECNFDDPAGTSATLEGANLKGANLNESHMNRVILRVATLKNATMKDCDLCSAVLAGADLEFCDLSGSDLCGANLRGANLKDTILALMQTPLHMSQTIR